MGQPTLTLPEAAKTLDVSERSVRTYIEQGYLSVTKKRGSRRIWLDAEEVQELVRDRTEARGKAVVTKAEFLQMRAQLRRLQAEMAVVNRILDSKSDPLRMPADYAKELYKVCLAQLQSSTWTPEEMSSWVEIFLRLDESDFEDIAKATETQKPWKPFLQLCVAMSLAISKLPTYPTDLGLQSTHKQLAEGRRRLRVAALIYVEMHGSVDPDIARYAMYDAPSSVVDSLRKIVSRKR